ncbi:MAG: ARMT1-like domain-containing protein, partial [Anaerolineae bacterium]
MTSELGSFARYTIAERKPQIISRVLADNDYPPGIVVALEALRAEIAHGAIQPLVGTTPDAAFWNRAAAAYRGRTWLELPWFFAETYFYRRLLEVVGYFAPGPWQGHDPFAPQKRQQEQEAVAWLNQHWPQLDAPGQEGFEILLHSSLWGNRADLSNLTVREEVRGGLQARQERHNLLIDDTGRIAARLSAGV